MMVVGSDARPTEVAVTKGDGGELLATTDAETAFTTLNYGVSNRGEGQTVLLRYHAKGQPVGGQAVGLPLELTSKGVNGGVVFMATAGGKPLGGVTVTVFEPGSDEPRTVTTDPSGQTPAYAKAGRYAVRVGRFEKAKGEHEGRAYAGVWEYSTLTTEVK
ncbi:MAG: hypothetical protein MUF18_18145 [Fimbriiglobus sp.]|nr:hypothetical protein [Fimbriiglobus sp.]